MRPHLGRSVLEVGAGAGVFSEKLAGAGLDRLVLGEADGYFLARLRDRYASTPGVEVAEIVLPGPLQIGEPVDSAVAMNVLEHIEDDIRALGDLATAVRPGGTIVLWAPAHMRLYGDFDRKLGHVRRYSTETMRAAVEDAGLAVRLLHPINALGALAWWAAVRRGGVQRPNPRLAALYDAVVVPTSRALERVVTPPFGQSLLCVAEVRGGDELPAVVSALPADP